MTLSSMVVSRDWQEVSVLECILGSLQMDVAVEHAPERALARLNKNKIDALIVDCDLEGTSQFLRELQREHRHPNTVPLVIMGSRQRKKDQAQVAWRDGRGNLGIRFLKVAPHLQRVLHLWLAQQYFTN